MEINELKKRLIRISDSYYSFVVGVLVYASKNIERADKVARFLDENPYATSSDVVEFVSSQPDFYEDAAPMKVV